MDAPGPRLTIAQLGCRINLPAGLESPGPARDRLARIAERDLPAVCAEALAAMAGEGDAVYRIRDLHLDLWVDLQGMDEAEIARRWGRLLAGSVLRAMRRGGPQQVRRFDSPRRFVAAFLRDLLDGRAWNQWCYAEFRRLQRLPVPAIAVQLLAARPEWIAPLLAELAITGHAERLIVRWRGEQIAQLWAALGFADAPALDLPEAEIAPLLAELAELWPRTALSACADAESRARDRMRLWLALTIEKPALTHRPAAGGLVRALVDLAVLLRAEPDLAPVLLMASGLYPAALRRIGAGPLADAASWLAGASSTEPSRVRLAWLAEVVSTHARPRVTEAVASGLEARLHVITAPLTSPVGSVFLLVPALAELGLWECWLAELGEETARRCLFVVALKALGRERATLLLADRLLAAFAGLDEPPAADARLPLEADGPPGDWAAALPEIAARWVPAHERDLVVAEVAGLSVLRDAKGGHWLAAWPASQATALDLGAARRDLSAEERAAIEAEAAHLQLGQRLGYAWLTPSLDAALSAATSLALRRTAARLPGFQQASPAYLASQFLAQPASLHADAESWTVRLSGGPLAVVLRLAVLPESLDVPWLDGPLSLTLTS